MCVCVCVCVCVCGRSTSQPDVAAHPAGKEAWYEAEQLGGSPALGHNSGPNVIVAIPSILPLITEEACGLA